MSHAPNAHQEVSSYETESIDFSAIYSVFHKSALCRGTAFSRAETDREDKGFYPLRVSNQHTVDIYETRSTYLVIR